MTDVVGIGLNKVFKAVLVAEFAVFDLLGILFKVHFDDGADVGLIGLGNGIAVHAVRDPLIALLRLIGASQHGDLIGHHKGRIKADAELTDDICGLVFFLGGHILFKGKRARTGDGAEVFLKLLLGHTDTVIGYGDGTLLLIKLYADGRVGHSGTGGLVGKGKIGELVYRVVCVRYKLAEEYLLICVN